MVALVKQVEKYLDPILAVELTHGDVLHHVDKVIAIVLEEAANMVKASAIRSGGGVIAETLIKDIRALKGRDDD